MWEWGFSVTCIFPYKERIIKDDYVVQKKKIWKSVLSFLKKLIICGEFLVHYTMYRSYI